jgi:asparagine synthase (glutamine-hydrolysing)
VCGIGGYLETGPLSARKTRVQLLAIADALAHRGPDDEGLWLEPASGIALCHRRLAVLELSPLAHQPMISHSGRFTITYNGEIYNHAELRDELECRGHVFRGRSDTEVLLAAIEQWGITETLTRSRGMFAFGLWDAAERALWLARDRFGEKPLYYGQFRGDTGRVLVFGSELKALRRHEAWNVDIDRDALALYLRHDFIPAPRTIFRQVRKVQPGCALRIHAVLGSLAIMEQQYWRPSVIAEESNTPGEQNPNALLEGVHEALTEAIRLQMVADVPIGAFLSGGIDSTLVVAMMQKLSSRPVHTFTIGFDEQEFNEAPFARRVAQHLETQHTAMIVTAREAMAVIPKLPRMYDEPFADSSQIPTSLVCSLARKDVTVALSGDAGDELFGGYPRYMEVRARWRSLQRVPAALRNRAARALELTPDWALGTVTSPLRAVARLRGKRQVGDRIQERAYAWGARSLPELYEAMISYWQPADRFVIGCSGLHGVLSGAGARTNGIDPLAHMMYADTQCYLPDDILVKVDRAAMAVSLETRVPLLDPGVARAAWRIPSGMHMRDGKGKWVLRELLRRHVPRELVDRPKKGFAVPVGRWLRKELRDWAAALLDPARMRRERYFEVSLIERRWHQHLNGGMDWSPHLWGVLMFQAWLEDFGLLRDSRPCTNARSRLSWCSHSNEET